MLFGVLTRWLRRPTVPAGTFRPGVESLEGRAVPTTTAAPIVVHAGESIQAAVTNAPAGSTILIQAGTYKEAVTVDKANMTLMGLPGRGGVVIENPGGATDGVSVTPNGAGFSLRNVTVRDFNENGVLLTGVEGFRLTNVRAVNNHDYGLFPVLSSDGVIDSCTASGSHDTGIYVGQSSDVTVRFSTAHDNVNGFEVENSTGVSVYGNLAYANTVGIFVDLLPPIEGITVTTAANDTVADNVVLDNNRRNDANPTDIAAAEQSGVGILFVGGDHMTVRDNFVTGNNTGGIVLLSGLDLEALVPALAGAYEQAGIDPNPEHAAIQDNVVLFNGRHPTDPTQPHADLIASPNALKGSGNHFRGNLFGTSFPKKLP